MTHLTEEELVQHYYGELDEKVETANHLATCDNCRARFVALEHDLSLLNTAAIPSRPADYGRRLWQQLQPKLDGKPIARQPSWFALPQWKLAAAAVLMVAAGFVAGRFGPGRETHRSEPISEAARERVLLATIADHLDQSRVALLELANGSDDSAADFTKTRASELVAANRLYRQSAAQAGEINLASILDELERVLIEIANRPPDVTRAELRELRRRIDEEDLLFKIRVLSSEVRSREKDTVYDSLL